LNVPFGAGRFAGNRLGMKLGFPKNDLIQIATLRQLKLRLAHGRVVGNCGAGNLGI
jgi:hypothetical protein